MEAFLSKATEFRRGKGNKSSRLGPRLRIESILGQKEIRKQTPDDIAIKKLTKLLGPDFRDVNYYITIAKGGEQLRFMNMPVLAAVITYFHSVINIITAENIAPDHLHASVNFLIQKETKDMSATDKEIVRIRMHATFLRYLEYFDNLYKEYVRATA